MQLGYLVQTKTFFFMQLDFCIQSLYKIKNLFILDKVKVSKFCIYAKFFLFHVNKDLAFDVGLLNG